MPVSTLRKRRVTASRWASQAHGKTPADDYPVGRGYRLSAGQGGAERFKVRYRAVVADHTLIVYRVSASP
jgi:hypothetical protein